MESKEFYDGMRKKMAANPEKIDGIKGVFTFDWSSSNDGIWTYIFDGVGKNVQLLEGPPPEGVKSDVYIASKWQYFVPVLEGTGNMSVLMMTGKAKMKGSMAVATQLKTLLEL